MRSRSFALIQVECIQNVTAVKFQSFRAESDVLFRLQILCSRKQYLLYAIELLLQTFC